MKNCLLLRSNLQAYLLCFRWTASLYAILQNSCLKVCAHLHIPPLLTLKHECESRHTWRNGNKCLLPFLSFKDNFSCEHSMLLYAHVFRAEPSLFIISNDQFIISRPRSWLIFFFLSISAFPVHSIHSMDSQGHKEISFLLSTHNSQVTSVPSCRTSLDIWCKYETSSN